MNNDKCWMMIDSEEFYQNDVLELPNGKWTCTITDNHSAQFSYDFNTLHTISLEFDDREDLVFALVSVEGRVLSDLLNVFSFGGSGVSKMNLIVHEILKPWKEK